MFTSTTQEHVYMAKQLCTFVNGVPQKSKCRGNELIFERRTDSEGRLTNKVQNSVTVSFRNDFKYRE